MPKLALRGGKSVLSQPLPPFVPSPMDAGELSAAERVIKSGRLSDFVAANNEFFLGGVEVRRFEKLFADYFKIKHAVACNSATTALHAAITALKIGPGDEVIVSPYTMSATASCVLMNGAIPVFADINAENFCLDPDAVRKKITDKTKAIIVVNLFGAPADFDELLTIARENNIKVIEDNAQAAGALYQGKFTGTIGDIGVFSFNIHKSIQCGEGGVLVTNDDHLALRAQLARNHGEVVADQMPDLADKIILGSNYRMTELAAAVAYEQLLKLEKLNQTRIEIAQHLDQLLAGIAGLSTLKLKPGNKSVYYVYPLMIDQEKFGISRDQFADAMTAEGFPMSKGYVKPIYLLPIYQEKQVFNDTKFPFDGKYNDHQIDYSAGLCPVCERLYRQDLTYTTICQYPYTKNEADLFARALKKILDNREELL